MPTTTASASISAAEEVDSEREVTGREATGG
jgi:hypothetical protein